MSDQTLHSSKSIFQTALSVFRPKLETQVYQEIQEEREKIRKIAIGMGDHTFFIDNDWQEQSTGVQSILCSLSGEDCTVINVIFKNGHIPEHFHDRLEHVFVATGTLTECLTGRVLGEGESMTIPPNVKHEWRSDHAKLTVVWRPPYD
jgi:quercetin dioxygenase-like cupin family protein